MGAWVHGCVGAWVRGCVGAWPMGGGARTTFAIQMTLQVSKVPPGTHSHVLVSVGLVQSTPDEQQWWPGRVKESKARLVARISD